MRFSTYTLGCKVNQFETQGMENILISRGHSLVNVGEGCDACIINTCTVTGSSAGKSRRAVRRIKRLEPGAIIVVCGCLSQLAASEICDIGVDIIGGSGERANLVLKLEERFSNRNRHLEKVGTEVLIGDPKERKDFEVLPCGAIDSSKTRALLKIQDGCNNFCSYCVIPYARGRSRSLPLSSISEQASLLSEQGFREVVITGIEISAYGKDLFDRPSLIDVLQSVSEAASDMRIRIGSLDPRIVDNDFCKKLATVENLCDHFHLSVQSGCDETLKRMGRKYTTSVVLGAILLLRELFPNCGITSDLITGFPDESDLEFEKTQQFIEVAAFSDMHIFPFSPRLETSAAKMPNQVRKEVKDERARLATEIQGKLSHEFKLSQVGKAHEVLFEQKRNGYWIGYSTNYLQVAVKAGAGVVARNEVRRVLVKSCEDGMLMGELREERVERRE